MVCTRLSRVDKNPLGALMKHAFFIFILMFPALSFPANAPIYSSYSIGNPGLDTLRKLNEKFDVARRTANGYEVIVPEDRAGELLKIVPLAQLVEKDINDVFRRLDIANPGWRNEYRSFDSVQKELKQISQSHADIALLENYGVDEQSRQLLVLRLTGKQPLRADVPELMITSATHGDEIHTVEMLMEFIQGLVQGYGTDSRITKMLDEHVVYFIPVVCPDGYVHYTRACEGLDPNRDYPYPGSPSHNSIAAIKNETLWFAKHKIAGSLDIHENLSTVMYPWAYTSSGPSQDDLPRFKEIGKVMAEDTGYNFGQIADVFGIARGSSADYWYWKGKTLAFGFEIGGRFPGQGKPSRELDRGNEEALRHFIEYF